MCGVVGGKMSNARWHLAPHDDHQIILQKSSQDDSFYVLGNFYDEDYDDEYDYDDNYIDGVYGSKKEFSSGLSDNKQVKKTKTSSVNKNYILLRVWNKKYVLVQL